MTNKLIEIYFNRYLLIFNKKRDIFNLFHWLDKNVWQKHSQLRKQKSKKIIAGLSQKRININGSQDKNIKLKDKMQVKIELIYFNIKT